ncbi:solute carrier family 22 member 5-like isoform X3 [Simochromis diagramma]|uniref:solute carrier family 22 member 5-like isoform X3 n=1 Tax=Simochromis diagramma TaxID=43689 RepID=UPI001A7E20F6|nr:solute carrier family 22 member 5-like isoform X3 [Simochromis diagramma]
MQDYDEVTAFLGHWGHFQQSVFFLLCASVLPNGFGSFSLIFLTDIPRHHCLVPDINLTEDWHQAIIPMEMVNGKLELSRCRRYRLDVVKNLSAQGYIPGQDVNLTNLEQEGCVDGWSYSKDIYKSTIVSEFDLVCSEEWKQPFTSTVYFMGVLVGSFFSGQLSDRLIPESPRWLLSQGRVEEAENIVKYAAKKNKVEAPQVIFDDYDSPANKTQANERHSIFSLLRTANIRNTSIILCLVWFTLSTGYFGLSLNTSRLHADPFISCFISAAVEVPAYITSWLALQYFPRRLAVISILLLGGVSLYFIQVVPHGLSYLSITLEMVGKFGITTGTALMFVYTAELFPTVLRNTATGMCTTVSRVGSCIAPFLLKLSQYFKYLPYITLGTLAVVSAFTTVFLPESFGRPLPQTIEQMHKRERMKCPFITRKGHSKHVKIFESRL